MNVSQISVDRVKAAEEYKAYSDAVKRNAGVEYLQDLKVAYGHLRRGHPVLDVWQSFAETGLDANGDPKIAVARADWPEVVLSKLGNSSTDHNFQAVFSNQFRSPHHSWRANDRTKLFDFAKDFDVPVPRGTWTFRVDERGNLTRTAIKTKVPIIPARFVPPHGLSNYHILWEVEKWDLVTPPRDPLLLKRVSPNVFVVLAAWELSDLERAVLRGRIA